MKTYYNIPQKIGLSESSGGGGGGGDGKPLKLASLKDGKHIVKFQFLKSEFVHDDDNVDKSTDLYLASFDSSGNADQFYLDSENKMYMKTYDKVCYLRANKKSKKKKCKRV